MRLVEQQCMAIRRHSRQRRSLPQPSGAGWRNEMKFASGFVSIRCHSPQFSTHSACETVVFYRRRNDGGSAFRFRAMHISTQLCNARQCRFYVLPTNIQIVVSTSRTLTSPLGSARLAALHVITNHNENSALVRNHYSPQ